MNGYHLFTSLDRLMKLKSATRRDAPAWGELVDPKKLTSNLLQNEVPQKHDCPTQTGIIFRNLYMNYFSWHPDFFVAFCFWSHPNWVLRADQLFQQEIRGWRVGAKHWSQLKLGRQNPSQLQLDLFSW